MRPLRSILLLLACLATTCLAGLANRRQYNYGFDVHSPFERRHDVKHPIVTGLPRENGTIPLRREIRDLEKDPDIWNLFILALSWMQYTDQNKWSSWYQIAGMPMPRKTCFPSFFTNQWQGFMELQARHGEASRQQLGTRI